MKALLVIDAVVGLVGRVIDLALGMRTKRIKQRMAEEKYIQAANNEAYMARLRARKAREDGKK